MELRESTQGRKEVEIWFGLWGTFFRARVGAGKHYIRAGAGSGALTIRFEVQVE